MASQGYAASASERPMSEGVGMPVVVGEHHDQSHRASNVNGPHTSAAYGSVNNMNMNGGAGYVASEGWWKTGGETFLLATFVLGLIAWLTSLVATAVVAATISSPAVRILWFAVVIQTLATFLVFQVIIGSEIHQYNAGNSFGAQIAILSAIACVFAVFGVDQNIYSSVSSQQATGAGWLLVAITDLLWILYFTSPEDSPFSRFAIGFGALGRGGARGWGWSEGGEKAGGGAHATKVQKISRSTDAFNGPPVNANADANANANANANTNSGRYDDGQSVEMTKVGHGQEPSGQSAQKRSASGKWSSYTPVSGPDTNTNARGTMVSAGGDEESEGGSGGIPFGGTAAQQAAGVSPPMSPAPIPEGGSKGDSEPKWRAKAMFDYKGSKEDASELAFKKGEILFVYDKSGKWWEAKNMEGKKGIAPSNYLQLL